MGRFSVEMEVANNDDLAHARMGGMPADKVRRMRLSGVVDTGASRLVLPAVAVEALGMKESESVGVRFADGRKEKRKLVTDVWVSVLGRHGVFSAVVEPGRDDALIGAIVMEELDLIVDCTTQQLRPRDPDRILAEIE